MLKYNKIRNLYRSWPNHSILTTDAMKRLGYSNSNIQKYLSSGWIESIGEGAYKKPGDLITWQGAFYALINSKPCHIGGKTALEEQGAGHYIKMTENSVYIFSDNYDHLPKWFLNANLGTQIAHINTNFIESDIGITYKDYGDLKLPISSRERAILEFIFLINKEHSFEECNLIMENLGTLRPHLVQGLLEACNSVQVKRIFLFLVSYNKHNFIEELNLDKIYLGSGYREVVKNGIYDPKFKINYPPGLKNEHENNF